jgi:hypothetical protein
VERRSGTTTPKRLHFHEIFAVELLRRSDFPNVKGLIQVKFVDGDESRSSFYAAVEEGTNPNPSS